MKRLSLAEEKGGCARAASSEAALPALGQAAAGAAWHARQDRQTARVTRQPGATAPKKQETGGGGGVGVKAAAACLGARLLYGDLSGKQTREKWIR